MTSLATQQIQRCPAGTVCLPADQCTDLLLQLPRWEVLKIDGVSQLVKTYHLDDNAQALQFCRQIAVMADAADHHPRLHTDTYRLTVHWWTHTIKGLHLNDFIMAARCDDAFSRHFGTSNTNQGSV